MKTERELKFKGWDELRAAAKNVPTDSWEYRFADGSGEVNSKEGGCILACDEGESTVVMGGGVDGVRYGVVEEEYALFIEQACPRNVLMLLDERDAILAAFLKMFKAVGIASDLLDEVAKTLTPMNPKEQPADAPPTDMSRTVALLEEVVMDVFDEARVQDWDGTDTIQRRFIDRLEQYACAVRMQETERIARSETFWKGVYDLPMDGQQAMSELADFSVIADHLTRTYFHVTDGRISKPMTLPEEVFAVADEITAEKCRDAYDEAMDDVFDCCTVAGDGTYVPHPDCFARFNEMMSKVAERRAKESAPASADDLTSFRPKFLRSNP